MPGVQSFVAQRQQGLQSSSRQILGAQNRIPIPRTNLETIRERPSFHGPNAVQPAGLPVAGHNTHSSKQQSTRTSIVHGGFDTDAEGFDDTATISTVGNIQCYQAEEDYCDQRSNWQEQTYHIEGSRQLDLKDSGGDADECSYAESSEVEEDKGSDKEELIHDGILQDLNSLGFSQYLQGQTSDTTRAALPPIVAVPQPHGSLTISDVAQHSQNPANPAKAAENGIHRGAADPRMNLQRPNHQAHERVTEQSLEVPVKKVQGSSLEQLSISAYRRRLSDRHSSSQQPSVNPQTRRPTEVTQDVIATYSQPQLYEDGPLLAQKGSVGLSTTESSVAWGSDASSRHDRMPTATSDGQQTQKRAIDLDYRLDQISSLTFEQLSNEPFDLASNAARPSLPQEISRDTLAAKMDYILKKINDDEAKFVQRKAFFSSLSIEQYEECGNLIIGRFSAIILKLTDARQQRRRVAKDFEEEIAQREGCIRGQTTIVSRNLDRLKRGGEEVVRGAVL